MMWLWFGLTMVGFGAGLSWSLVRARRRMQAHLALELEAEIKRRVQMEILRRLGADPAAVSGTDRAGAPAERGGKDD